VRPLVAPLLLVATFFAVLLGPAAPAGAQSGGRATPTMRQHVYEQLSQASERVAEEQTDEAMKILRDVEKIKDLTPYEKAQLHTAIGYVQFLRDDMAASIRAYETVLAQEGLPEVLRATTQYTLAQLYFQVEEYRKSVESLQAWLGAAVNPGPEPYVLLAQGYYQLGEYRKGIDPILTAMRIAETRARRVEESWYLLLRVFWFELKNNEKVLEVLETLVREYPKKEYWVQLGAVYGEVGQEDKRLAAYRAAYRQGFLDRDSEIVVLAQLLVQANVPYGGAVVLARAMDEGVVPRTAENLRLLSQAWTLAQEDRKSIAALKEAAGISDDGELDARLADAHANLAEWESVVGAARSALDKGVARPGQVQLLLGMALFELGRFDEARSTFLSARSSPETERTASQWVSFVDSEQKRLAELDRAMRN